MGINHEGIDWAFVLPMDNPYLIITHLKDEIESNTLSFLLLFNVLINQKVDVRRPNNFKEYAAPIEISLHIHCSLAAQCQPSCNFSRINVMKKI